MEVLEKREHDRLCLVVDEYPSNPREEYDHLANVVTVPGFRYIDIDKDGGPLAGAWHSLLMKHGYSDAVDIFERYARVIHSAVTLYDTPHEGASGVWYLTAEAQQEVPDPMACLKAERDEYRSWASGDVWGYVIERKVTWVRTDMEEGEMTTWESVDSCFGYYGYDYAVEAAREAWANHCD